ncbi:kinase-like domain-containing protein [Trichophaea hybrida]|nr:kinase-like domain-containing protein [Trichophaea hybrida]
MSKHGRSTSKPMLWVTTTSPTQSPASTTPPRTPVGSIATDWSSLSEIFDAKYTLGDSLAAARQKALLEMPPHPFGAYTEDVQCGSNIYLGSGVWSEVVRGTLAVGNEKIVVAIKKPCHPDGCEILRDEAKILSYITGAGPRESIVRFLGFDSLNANILMECVTGMTLGKYSRRKKAERRGTRSEPVIGLTEWLYVAKELTDSFVHLKSIGVVHGDVTWNNILMKEIRTESGFQYTPVIIDFSSGNLEVQGYRPAAVSATTTAFCSPELLEAHIRGPITPPQSPTDKSATRDDPRPIPTYASDLYGLAMTLLSAAIGSEVYENASRYAGIYARQGQPLDWVRNGDACLIVGVRSIVSKALNGCFGRVAEKRVQVEELRDRLNGYIESAT